MVPVFGLAETGMTRVGRRVGTQAGEIYRAN